MKKIFKTILLMGVMLVTLAGCTTSKSFTYNVSTGDAIKVELDTSDGYDLTSDLPFTISKDDKILSQGSFITLDGYKQYLAAVDGDDKAEIIESDSRGGITYTFYSYNDSEFNYIIKVDGSKTGILLGNPNSKAEAKECFERLTFSLD